MAIYSVKNLDENKVMAFVHERLEELDERIQIRKACQPIVEKWTGKKPNVKMQRELKAALSDGDTCPYIVSGPKSYTLQEWTIYGRNTHSEEPETVKRIGPYSRIRHGSSVQIFLGYLDGNNLTPITKEKVEESAKTIELHVQQYHRTRQLLKSKDFPIQTAVREWNAAIETARKIERSMEPYSLSYLFNGDYNRGYDIYQD